MIRRPPRSTLFPTRRSSDLRSGSVSRRSRHCSVSNGCSIASRLTRSEEHTSELQSLTNLVCRLLLEKKKKKNYKIDKYEHKQTHENHNNIKMKRMSKRSKKD